MQRLTDQRGQARTITLAAPAAGADFANVTLPTGRRYRILGFTAAFTTVVGAAKVLRINVQIGSGPVLTVAVGPNAATAATIYVLVGGLALAYNTPALTIAPSQVATFPIADTIVDGGAVISFVTDGELVGDQYGAGALTVELV